MLNQDVYISINKGETLTKQNRIFITNTEIVLGREGRDFIPDVSFTSQYISRKHALIGVESGNYYIIDLKSKHGTEINYTSIEKNKPFFLHDRDVISLAQGTSVLTFHHHLKSSLDKTLELPILQNDNMDDSIGLTINIERREILIDGVQIYLTSKDTGLFWLLHQNKGCAVSYDEIKITVWPERILHKNEKPDVGREEINMLVYRLRKKLGKYGKYINSVPRYGYILDL
ncbi:FHA domain-containing protein [Lysinibacillus sp. NPDC097279]|uniref:FHA domain-containing protein n=1 Tax=Lysinibacillus sp. NPDC097279 TaxID=3364143 RepID=UPI0037F667CE